MVNQNGLDHGTSVDIGPAYVNYWQRLDCLQFRVYVKVGNSLEQNKKHSFVSIKKKNICQKKNLKFCYKHGLHQYLPHAQGYLFPLYNITATAMIYDVSAMTTHYIIQVM